MEEPADQPAEAPSVPIDEQGALEAYVRRVHGEELARMVLTYFDALWARSAPPAELLHFLGATQPPDEQCAQAIREACAAGEPARALAALTDDLAHLVRPVIDAYACSPDKERVEACRAAGSGAAFVKQRPSRTHPRRCELAMDAVQRCLRAHEGASAAQSPRGAAAADGSRASAAASAKRKDETWALAHGSPASELCTRVRVFDYAPGTFGWLRARAMEAVGVAGEDGDEGAWPSLALSLGGWRSLGPAVSTVQTSSRSGALYWESSDGRCFVKTVGAKEAKTLRSMLPAYVSHLERYHASLLPRFVGLFKARLLDEGPSAPRVYLLAMRHLFAACAVPGTVAEQYDLKGSTVDRYVGAGSPRAAGGTPRSTASGSRSVPTTPPTQRATLDGAGEPAELHGAGSGAGAERGSRGSLQLSTPPLQPPAGTPAQPGSATAPAGGAHQPPAGHSPVHAEAFDSPRVAGGALTRKDLDLTRPVRIGPSMRRLLLAQLEVDSRLLERHELMDYSLLLGVGSGAETVERLGARRREWDAERVRRWRYRGPQPGEGESDGGVGGVWDGAPAANARRVDGAGAAGVAEGRHGLAPAAVAAAAAAAPVEAAADVSVGGAPAGNGRREHAAAGPAAAPAVGATTPASVEVEAPAGAPAERSPSHAAAEPDSPGEQALILLLDTPHTPHECWRAAYDELRRVCAGRARVTVVDVDSSPAQAARWSVAATPTVIVLQRGTEVLRVVGLRHIVRAWRWLPALLDKLYRPPAVSPVPSRARARVGAPAASPEGADAPAHAIAASPAAAPLADGGSARPAAPAPAGAAAAREPPDRATGAGAPLAEPPRAEPPPCAEDARAASPASATAPGAPAAERLYDEGVEVAADGGTWAEDLLGRTLVRGDDGVGDAELRAMPRFHVLSLFRQDLGGMAARGPADERLDSGEVFVMGIVDILQQWDFAKRVESRLKALRWPLQMYNISAVDPQLFRSRFLEYVARVVE